MKEIFFSGINYYSISYKEIFLYFPVYAFLGWIGEVIYRSSVQKKFINPGLIIGPFLPLYGSISIIIIAIYSVLPLKNIFLDFILFSVLVTFLEYLAAALAENYFKVRLWEYDDYRFNIKGRVCLRFAFFWGAYVLIFLYIIHPIIAYSLSKVNSQKVSWAAIIVNIGIAIDFLISVQAMKRFVSTLHYFIEGYLNFDNTEIEQYLNKMRRQFQSFGALRKYADLKLKNKFEDKFSKQLVIIKKYFNEKLFSRKPDESEYNLIIKEILSNSEFQLLENFLHHDSSILNHAKKVSYTCYKITKLLGLDYVSAARGALLHDFFLYDWRKLEGRPYEGGMHGFKHPKVALKNSEKHFSINTVEKDIILRHMWPLTIIPPRFKESIIVSLIDKYVSSQESVLAVKNNIKKHKNLK